MAFWRPAANSGPTMVPFLSFNQYNPTSVVPNSTWGSTSGRIAFVPLLSASRYLRANEILSSFQSELPSLYLSRSARSIGVPKSTMTASPPTPSASERFATMTSKLQRTEHISRYYFHSSPVIRQRRLGRSLTVHPLLRVRPAARHTPSFLSRTHSFGLSFTSVSFCSRFSGLQLPLAGTTPFKQFLFRKATEQPRHTSFPPYLFFRRRTTCPVHVCAVRERILP